MNLHRDLRLWWFGALAFILVLGLALRMYHLTSPVLDHPSWRQGDTAAIARNFATIDDNPMHPQLDYDGPGPHYVELELQIVPWIAAAFYKVAGVNESIGRSIAIAFSLGTTALLAFFGAWLFKSRGAGLCAALTYAIMPGSIYYGRTFMPESAMVFLLTAALVVLARLFEQEAVPGVGPSLFAVGLLTLAVLAKPVALLAAGPIVGLVIARMRKGRPMPWLLVAALLLVPLAAYAAYDAQLWSAAQWRWPRSLAHAVLSQPSVTGRLHAFGTVLAMLRRTMAGPVLSLLALAGLLTGTLRSRAPALVWGWIAAAIVYALVVVTVVRVDYYLAPLLPLAALLCAAVFARFKQVVTALAIAAIAAVALVQSRAIIDPYYRYDTVSYDSARALDRTLPRGALVVAGYDPAFLYYVHRFGWQVDLARWSTRDERRVIAAGARYVIVNDPARLARNAELCRMLLPLRRLRYGGALPVYLTGGTGPPDKGSFVHNRSTPACATSPSVSWRTTKSPTL